jgi:hypothetical protein
MSGDLATKRTRLDFEIALSFFALAGYPVVGVVIINHVAAAHGRTAQIGVGFAIFAGFFIFLKYWYRWIDHFQMRRRAYIRDVYRGIYRVKVLPVSKWTWLKENIKTGDYGWEMEAAQKDDLIYLHGLNDQWRVVWIGGFRREDLEYVGLKPVSEYDWREFDYDGPRPTSIYSRVESKAKTPCPFPVNMDGRAIVRFQYPV